jgi:ABC-type dipeptide/oligopeptide/nickel transport system permease component
MFGFRALSAKTRLLETPVLRFLMQRVLLAIPSLLLVSLLVFMVVRLIPGDPAQILAGDMATPQAVAELRAQWGLDRPLPVQYLTYLKNLLAGNLGRSVATRNPVTREIGDRYPTTVGLAATGILVAAILGLGAGVLAASKPFSRWDYGSMILALTGVSTPVFWSGLILILIFSVWLGWLPSGGTGSLRHMILPAFSLGLFDAGVIARQSRAGLLEVLEQDYIRTARAKGLAERMVVVRHAFKNAVIPVVTVIGMQFGRMLGGAVLVESVFSLPGIGRLLVTAISQRDYPVIQGICLLLAASFVIINLAVDVAYGYLDPRIRQ